MWLCGYIEQGFIERTGGKLELVKSGSIMSIAMESAEATGCLDEADYLACKGLIQRMVRSRCQKNPAKWNEAFKRLLSIVNVSGQRQPYAKSSYVQYEAAKGHTNSAHVCVCVCE